MAANRYVVLVGLLTAGSAAHAAPSHRQPAVAATVPADVEADTDADTSRTADPKPAPAVVAEARERPESSGWTFAVGPYVWMSSVQLGVAFGPLNTGVDIGFVSLARHARYGGQVALEARHGRFGISADVMYAAAQVQGSTEIASVMTTVTGQIGSLMLEPQVSYAVLGGDGAPLSLEARSGVRYQRTTIQGEVGVAGFTLRPPEIVDDGADFLLGARATVRPRRWLELAGAFDVGVAGASDSTWSTTVDARVRASSRILLSAGWRSLTARRGSVTTQMQGPLVAVQLVF